MKNSRKMFILIEIVLAFMLILVAAAMLHERGGRQPERIAVILREPDAGRWAAFKYGLRAAAEDMGVEVLIVSAEEQPDAAGEETMLKREIVNGADAVILQPTSGDIEELLESIGTKVPVMLTGCPSYGDDKAQIPATGPDNDAMGGALAKELLADFGESLDGKTIGIFAETDGLQELKERANGFMQAIEGTGAVIEWSAGAASQEDAKNILAEQAAVDFVICLDDSSLVAAGKEAAAGNLHSARVYGIGHSTEAVYYLDMGNVERLVVPDEFNVGYQSLTEVARRLDNRFYRMKNAVISYTVLYRETLFSRENQELLYTMNQ
nr:substrate-binding domain-containing protein [uncultured Marvinbryantia sp.]